MNSSSLKKTAVAVAVAGALTAAGMPAAHANVVNISFKGAFTMLNATTGYIKNSPTDYANGFYGVTGAASGPATTYGWKGNRTPITGTLSFDTSTGAGVGTINPFLFFGNGNNNYWGTLAASFQVIDTVGTLVGSMLFSWNLGSHQASIVMDAGQMFAALPGLVGSGYTTTVQGTYAALTNPLVPASAQITTAIARTSTRNTGAGCDGLTLATQVNAYTINTNFANLGTCTTGMSDDGVPGDPMTSPAFPGFNANFDILSVHNDAILCLGLDCPPPPPIPIPPTLWLFSSGLLGLIGLARRKRPIEN